MIGLVLIAILSLAAVNNPYTEVYIGELKGKAVQVNQQYSNGLFEEINNAAVKYEAPPQDAKVDRVWKAMPGYNGLKVDVEASYQKMKSTKQFDDRKLVFKQIAPNVHLNDLPPAPIFRGHPDKPMVSFIINVAWGNEFLPGMLETLKENNVQATFFLEGRWVKENPTMAKLIADGGHELGNHSYSHPDMKKLDTARAKEEIIKTNEVIEAITEKKVVWFAPPSGSYKNETVNIASSLGLKTVMWTVDTIDWQKPSPSVLIQRVTTKVHPGAIILMHPTDPTEKALGTLIKELKNRNLRIGTITKLMDEERIVKLNNSNNEE